MKNVTRIIAFSLICVFTACTPEKTIETEEVEVVKDVEVVKEVEVVKVEANAPENSTEVSFGSDGVKLNTKDGNSGTKIEVKGGSTKIEVKGE